MVLGSIWDLFLFIELKNVENIIIFNIHILSSHSCLPTMINIGNLNVNGRTNF